jgi:hypothetical protein
MRMTDLKPGWAVVGNDGRTIGTIRDVRQNYVLASRRGLSGDIYVPASAIANVEGRVVHLNVGKSQADEMGWEQPPRESDELETKPEADLHRHI